MPISGPKSKFVCQLVEEVLSPVLAGIVSSSSGAGVATTVVWGDGAAREAPVKRVARTIEKCILSVESACWRELDARGTRCKAAFEIKLSRWVGSW